jgi:hypothetical protein
MSRMSRVLVIVAVAAVVLGLGWWFVTATSTANRNDIQPVGSQGYLPAAWVVVAPS